MPATPRIKTVTYSKESKKAPGYAWSVARQAPIRVACACANKKVTRLSSVIFGGTPGSSGTIIYGGGAGSSGFIIFGGIPGASFILGGTPTSSGPALFGGGPANSGPILSGGIV